MNSGGSLGCTCVSRYYWEGPRNAKCAMTSVTDLSILQAILALHLKIKTRQVKGYFVEFVKEKVNGKLNECCRIVGVAG